MIAKIYKNGNTSKMPRVREKIDKIVGIDARGFIFAAAAATKLHAGFVPVRKKGKLPAKTLRAEYALEYGTDCLEIHQDSIEPGQRALVVDDLIATGGTAKAVAAMIERMGGTVVGLSFVVELGFLNGRAKLAGYDVTSIVRY
jgi:adenine phosphoribosyltransferase